MASFLSSEQAVIPRASIPGELLSCFSKVVADAYCVRRAQDVYVIVLFSNDERQWGWYTCFNYPVMLMEDQHANFGSGSRSHLPSLLSNASVVYEAPESRLLKVYRGNAERDGFVGNYKHFVVPSDNSWIHWIEDSFDDSGELLGKWFDPNLESEFLTELGLSKHLSDMETSA